MDTELYNPQIKNTVELNPDWFPQTNSLKLLYAGNIGFAQSWEPLISLACKTKSIPIEYFVVGEGVMKAFIESKKQELDLKNVHILPYQPREVMPNILAYSDIQFIFMNPEMEMQGFPSKVYTIMSCAKPLLVCSGIDSPIMNFLQNYACAKLVTENDYNKKIDEMYNWLISVSKSELLEMGKNGLDIIKKYYSKEVVTKQYVDLVRSLE